jgi:uncharacterized Zn-binding protein involved in type VI secretion
MSGPAARLGDLTAHGSPGLPGAGSTDVFIGFKPAWRALEDRCLCPAPPGSHGTEMALIGSTTVMINRRMAVRVGDLMPGAGPPNSFVQGEATVIIGDVGFGMAKASSRAAFARAMRALLKDWSKLDEAGRVDALERAMASVLPRSMPALKVKAVKMSDPDTSGEMNFLAWQIDLNEKLLQGKMDARRMAELVNTMYHEGRHGEQWFHVAQSLAAAGVPASAIESRTGIPTPVAKAAANAPAARGTSEGEVGASVHMSVYGSRSAHREAVLNDLRKPKPRADSYGQYRALPEEEDAWRQGDAAENDYDNAGGTP